MIKYIVIGVRFFSLIVLLLVASIVATAEKTKQRKYVKIVIVVVCIWCIFFITDFIRVKLQKSPIFCERYFSSKIFSIQDGGTTSYIGLGYKVIHFNTYRSNIGIIDYYYICPWETTYEKALERVLQKI